MSSGLDASSSARRMLTIRRVFRTLSRRPSPVAKKRSRALSLNERITPQCKPIPYKHQELRYDIRNGAFWIGAPDKIRTCDLCLRRAALYPAELRARGGYLIA